MQSNAKESNRGFHAAAAVNQNVEDTVKQSNQTYICKAYAEQSKVEQSRFAAAAVNQNVEDIVKQSNQTSICKAYAEQRKCKAEQRRAIKVCMPLPP